MHSSLPAEYSSHECLAAPAGRDWFPTEWEGGCGGGGPRREKRGEEGERGRECGGGGPRREGREEGGEREGEEGEGM